MNENDSRSHDRKNFIFARNLSTAPLCLAPMKLNTFFHENERKTYKMETNEENSIHNK